MGGRLLERASNGTTEVFMNGREITQVELRMLQVEEFLCLLFFHMKTVVHCYTSDANSLFLLKSLQEYNAHLVRISGYILMETIKRRGRITNLEIYGER